MLLNDEGSTSTRKMEHGFPRIRDGFIRIGTPPGFDNEDNASGRFRGPRNLRKSVFIYVNMILGVPPKTPTKLPTLTNPTLHQQQP